MKDIRVIVITPKGTWLDFDLVFPKLILVEIDGKQIELMELVKLYRRKKRIYKGKSFRLTL